MMGHRAVLKGGDEYDALTNWRRFIRCRACRYIKRKFNKRMRQIAKTELNADLNEINS